MYGVIGNALYSFDSTYTATFIDNLNSSTGIVEITDNGVSLNIVDGADRYYYTWGTDTFAVPCAIVNARVRATRTLPRDALPRLLADMAAWRAAQSPAGADSAGPP